MCKHKATGIACRSILETTVLSILLLYLQIFAQIEGVEKKECEKGCNEIRLSLKRSETNRKREIRGTWTVTRFSVCLALALFGEDGFGPLFQKQCGWLYLKLIWQHLRWANVPKKALSLNYVIYISWWFLYRNTIDGLHLWKALSLSLFLSLQILHRSPYSIDTSGGGPRILRHVHVYLNWIIENLLVTQLIRINQTTTTPTIHQFTEIPKTN